MSFRGCRWAKEVAPPVSTKPGLSAGIEGLGDAKFANTVSGNSNTLEGVNKDVGKVMACEAKSRDDEKLEISMLTETNC
jgi:hypothetical protein